MRFSFDSNGNLKQSKMFLYSSKTKPIGVLSGACNVKLEQNFHKLFELNFKIYKNINNEENEFYDSVIKSKLIEVQYINWFQILSAVEKYDDNSKETYKDVKCCPLENMLIYRKVDDIVGVFGLYDVTDTSKSLLHIISAECGWSIGHVSNELLSKYRTFDINSMEIYNLLTTKISDSFGCVFQFDSYTKTINAYLLSELEEMTDIIISKKNILKEYIKDDSDSPIITKMRVRGADDLDIRSVNFGRNYLVNLDYYMTEDWCSQGLVDAYNTYKTDYNNIRTSFNTSLTTLKTKNAELTTLKAELKDLESLKSAQENVMGVSVQNHGRVPIPSDSDYTIYQNAVTLVNGYVAQIVTKKNQITSKQNEINSVQSTLDSISDSIDESNYFTPEQITEMNGFIVEGDDYEDSTFVVTSETTEEEALEIKTELMLNAYDELFIKSRPQYTFTIKATSLYTIQDDKDELISYSEWVSQFKIGSLITLNLGSNYMTVRLMTIIIDFDNPEEIDLVFSNKSRLDDELIQLAEIIADSGRTASSLSLKKMGYDAASKQTNQVREFMNGSLKATLNSFQTNDNQEMIYDEFGLHGRKWLPDQNKYDDRQLWINNNGMLLTSDGWKTASMGLGLLTAPDGNSYYGLNTEVIVGSLLLGGKLNITNPSGSYLIDNNGFSATNGIYSVGINPNTPSEILNIKVNGVKKFYIDTTTNQLVMNGVINATSGTLGSLTVTGTLTGGTISGATINSTSGNIGGWGIGSNSLTSNNGATIHILRGSNESMILDDNGLSLYNPNTLNKHYGNISSVYDPASGVGGILISQGLNANLFAIGHNTSASAYDLDMIFTNSGFSASSLGTYSAGFHFLRSVNVNASLTVRGKQVIHSGNIGSQSVSYASTAGSVSGLTTNQITASNTGYGNINFQGFDNAAGVNWVQLNFEPKTPSDVRLKYDIKSLDNIPDELFYSLKAKQFKYKTNTLKENINFGFIAQQVESAFNNYGLNPYDYNLVELKDVRKYTDDGYYVKDVTHRLNYTNLIAWIINIIQKQNNRIINLENKY